MGSTWVCRALPFLVALTGACNPDPVRGPEPVPVTSGPVLVFRGVRVFDGVRTIASATVVVRGGVIDAVGADVPEPSGAGVEVIDGTGRTLLPGLIDAHTHSALPRFLEEALVLGVTTELDMFSDPSAIADLKRQIAAEQTPTLADVRSAGFGATVPGGHGTQFGRPTPTVERPEDATGFVDARIAEGSDYLKLIYDDGSAHGFTMPTLNRPTLDALVGAAHSRKKIAVAHIGSLSEARGALEAGVDGLAHLFVGPTVDPQFGALVAKHGAFVVPTLSVLWGPCDGTWGRRAASDERLSAYLFPEDLRTLMASGGAASPCEIPRETIAQLRAAKVPILAGTDAPNDGTAHGASLHEELLLLVELGLTPAEALTAATAAPAAAFRLDDRGRIARGKRADLVLVEGDPTVDIRASRAIEGVWSAGRKVDREAHLRRVRVAGLSAPSTPKLALPDLVSDFEKGLTTSFGAGWVASTDVEAGGASSAELSRVGAGANNSKGALVASGTVRSPELPFAWAGAMFYPGTSARAPADLSGKRKIRFSARGQAQTYRLLFFAKKTGGTPFGTTFDVSKEWRSYEFELASLGGSLDDVTAILFAAGPWQGAFRLELDDVRIE